MADLALGGLERIIKAGLKIKKAVETVHQNKKGCRDVQTCVARVTALLSWLKEGAMMHHPSFTGPLDDLAESMEEALELITDCQQRSALRHLLGARDMAKQLCRVQEDIQHKLTTVMLATSILNLKISVSVTNTLHYVGAHPPLLLPQDAGRLNSNMSHSTTDGIRSNNISGSSSDTTMLTGGCEGPYPSSSRTESMLFEQDTAQRFSLENIAGGRHYFVGKQKIVIRLSIPSSRRRSKAMVLTSKMVGVCSMGITGDGKDRLEVVGESIDVPCLVNLLRKKICRADIVEVAEFKENTPFMLISPILTPQAMDQDNQRFNYPFPGSSSVSEESPSSSPRPASFKGKGKQEVRPHVAAPAPPDGPSPTPRGIMAHLRAAAAGLKASRLSAVHEWLVPMVPAYGIVFVFLFLLFLRLCYI